MAKPPAIPPPRADSMERVRELETELEDLRMQLQRSEHRVEAMKQIGRALGSNLELDPLLCEVVRLTTSILEADRTTLFLVDPDTQDLLARVLEGQELQKIRLPRGQGIAGWVAKHGRSLCVTDAYKDKRFDQSVDRRTGYRTRGILTSPVRRPQSNQLVGVVQVLNKREGDFEPDDARLLEAIAAELGVALEVSQLYGEAMEHTAALEETHRELSLLLDTERAISTSEDLSEMLGRILETARGIMRARSGVVYLLSEDKSLLEPVAARGSYAASLMRGRLPANEGLFAKVILTAQPQLRDEVEDERRGRLVVKQSLSLPIRTRREGVLAILELFNHRDGRAFNARRAASLEVVAAQAGRAIRAEQRRKERAQSERMSAIGRMLSGVVHDLRTPLTLISGYSEIMAETEDPEDRLGYAHRVKKQIDLVSAMTKELLSFARGERSVLIRKVYLQRFLEELRESLEQEFKGRHVKLSVQTDYRGTARFDETKLRRVFHNLARNARDAMPGGGEFSVEVKKEGSDLVFSFTDTGGGIPADLEGRLFEPFLTRGKEGGTGLGLAMVKQIVEEHQGSIRYQNTKRGTRFTLRLPLT